MCALLVMKGCNEGKIIMIVTTISRTATTTDTVMIIPVFEDISLAIAAEFEDIFIKSVIINVGVASRIIN